MTQGTAATVETVMGSSAGLVTVGIDVSDRHSQLCFLEDDGAILREERVHTTTAALAKALSARRAGGDRGGAAVPLAEPDARRPRTRRHRRQPVAGSADRAQPAQDRPLRRQAAGAARQRRSLCLDLGATSNRTKRLRALAAALLLAALAAAPRAAPPSPRRPPKPDPASRSSSPRPRTWVLGRAHLDAHPTRQALYVAREGLWA